MELECNEVINLIDDFFCGMLNREDVLAIIKHLDKCSNCEKFYTIYAKQCGLNFDLKTYKIRFLKRQPISTSDEIKAFMHNGHTAYLDTYWSDVCKMWDMEELVNLTCFRNLALEYDSEWDEGDTDYEPFYKFIMKKNCQRIDFLEKCLRIEKDGNNKTMEGEK